MIGQGVGLVGWSLLAVVVGVVGVAWFWEDDLDGASVWRVWQFRVLVMQLHLACAVLALGVVALVWRRWWLAVVSALVAVVVGGVLWIGPRAPEVAGLAGPTLRVVTANVYYRNPFPARAAADVAAHDADLILVQEWSTQHIAPFDAQLAETHPHRLSHPSDSPNGFAVYSKHPFRFEPTGMGRLDPKIRRLRLRWGDDEIVVYNVHPASPGSAAGVEANRLGSRLLSVALAKETLPTIVAGDFNHTPNTWNADAIRSAGFVGIGGAGTWPFNHSAGWIWPKFRIDDMLVGNGLGIANTATASTTGADHQAVVSEVGFAAD
ncbi:MAG: endonuclease/exonuclease/phosphatase family protein [Planctomycetota bacterium]